LGYWLWDRIKQWTNVTDTDIQRLELARNALISSIRVTCNTERDDTERDASTVCAMQWDDIDALRVLGDEEDVLKGVSGRECLGLNLYDFQCPPAWNVSTGRGDKEQVNYYLNFGKKPGDPRHCLDTSLWGHVTLEIEHSFDVTDKLGFATETADFTVWQLRRIGDLPFSNEGFLKTQRKYHWTGSATAREWRRELPIRNRYRRIAIFSHEDGYTPGQAIDNIELQLNDGALHPFWGQPYQMAVDQTRHFDIDHTFAYTFAAYNGAANALQETELPYTTTPEVSHRVASGCTAMAVQDVNASIVGINQTGNGCGYATVMGDGFMGCLLIPFDLGPDSDWLNSADYDKIELLINELVTRVPDMTVVLDELIPPGAMR